VDGNSFLLDSQHGLASSFGSTRDAWLHRELVKATRAERASWFPSNGLRVEPVE
jgi:hypothetical protein